MKWLGCIAAFFLFSLAALAQSPVVVTLNPGNPGPAIPDDFIGLSYESQHVLPDGNGSHLFSASNTALIKTFHLLGVENLRVGGNTVDSGPIPSTADVDNLFAFAKAAGVDVIYTLKLKNSTAADNAPLAEHILTNHAANLTCFSIGNEPTTYTGSFYTYESRVKSYMAAIGPRAKFCGADVEDGGQWASAYANAFANAGNDPMVTEHHYLGNGRINGGAVGRNVLLSPNAPAEYAKFFNGFAPTVAKDGFTFRLSETNSFFHGGAIGASETFASALWGLDYLHWWAAHGAAGLNFHTGDTVSSQVGGPNKPALYAVFVSSMHGYHVHPLGYGVKAFDVGRHGAVVPVDLANVSRLNFTAYGVLSRDSNLYVTLINKEHDSGARSARVTVVTGSSYAKGEAMFLTAPNSDVAATDGVTLGGAAIKDDGTWNGSFSTLPTPSKGKFTLDLPPATAVVLHLQPDRTDAERLPLEIKTNNTKK